MYCFLGRSTRKNLLWLINILRPIKQSLVNSVGVIGGTGLVGMRATLGNQYFAGGSGFADYMIFSLEMLAKGSEGIKMAGYFDNNWKITGGDSFMLK
ncbi:MAG: hypothetical protein JWQ30_878 [Sediminibacterium sp.]|nr:hypothetical protein [Sediminibacterium sp.]